MKAIRTLGSALQSQDNYYSSVSQDQETTDLHNPLTSTKVIMEASGSAPDTAPAETKQSNSANDYEDDPDIFTLFEPNEDCICEFGDIILIVNDGFHPIQKLRVSSCVLAMSSKVLKVLFSKRFSEGQRVQGRSAAEPQEIELQDAPTPMRQLCQVLHHQSVEDLNVSATDVIHERNNRLTYSSPLQRCSTLRSWPINTIVPTRHTCRQMPYFRNSMVVQMLGWSRTTLSDSSLLPSCSISLVIFVTSGGS